MKVILISLISLLSLVQVCGDSGFKYTIRDPSVKCNQDTVYDIQSAIASKLNVSIDDVAITCNGFYSY